MYRSEQIPVGGAEPAKSPITPAPHIGEQGHQAENGPLLPFRGQYCFGALPRSLPPRFQRHELPDGTVLAHDEDLPVFVKIEGDAYLAIIGLCFDHRHPEYSLADIGERLFAISSDEIAEQASALFGRWVAIKSDAQGKIAFSDAGGILPLIHRIRGESYLCASSSRLIAACDETVRPNPAIDQDFRTMQAKPGLHGGRPFPLRVTEYDGVFAVLPNHVFDLRSKAVRRYYFGPKDFGTKSADSMAPAIGDLIVRIVTAISARSKLAYAATGGFDSRLIAAGISRVPGLPEQMDFFTFRYPRDPGGAHYDIVLARKVAETIGGRHRVIDAECDYPDPTTSAICRQSEEFYATGFEGWVEKTRTEVEPDRIILMGWASEIARCFFRWPGSESVTPHQIADSTGLAGIEAFQQEFVDWFASAEEAHRRTGIPILDLFYWENRVGRWCSGGLNILNTGSNWMTIYSCRDLLDLMLSVRESERASSQQLLYRKVIKYLNPKVSVIPINPTPFSRRLKKATIHRVKTILLPIRRLRQRSAQARAVASNRQ